MRGRSNQYSKGPSETNDVPLEHFLSVLFTGGVLHKGGRQPWLTFWEACFPFRKRASAVAEVSGAAVPPLELHPWVQFPPSPSECVPWDTNHYRESLSALTAFRIFSRRVSAFDAGSW